MFFSPYSLIVRLFDKNYSNINLKNFDENLKPLGQKVIIQILKIK